jgi:NAD(P)-dependent dehydrogenase (short-subunit alcohol dehydrogenase family)
LEEETMSTDRAQRLHDKVVIITGGGTGIGLGIARSCAEEGAAVVLAQRRAEIAEREAAALRAAGHRALGLGCDVSRRDEVQGLIAAAVAAFGRLDVMVNNAALTGAAVEPRSFLDETDEHWRKIIDINLNGAFICTQAAARQMVSQGTGGSIINISSVAQFAAQEHAAPYCASKAGLDGLTKAAAIELAPYGIRVNNVAPGDIDTEASHDVVAQAADHGATGKFFRYTPLDRRGRPEEIGRVVAFLAGDDASFVTGATWLVDGGFLSY